ncbi:MAG: acyl carrier protein [Succinivibrio sp.]|nr:acyl carrier protein [Succinivibrio sp.]
MTIEEKLAIIKEILECEDADISVDTQLKDIDEWDSLSVLSLIMYMLDNYSIKVSGTDIRNFTKVQDIINLFPE